MTVEEKNQFNELRLLVVEDSEVQREHLIGLCRENGLNHIESAVNGQDALDVIAQQKFDLAIVDLEMPIMDGVELLRQIAHKRLVPSVMILSSKDQSLILSLGTMAEADGLNVVGTFQKPMTAERIQISLNRINSTLQETDEEISSDTLPLSDLIEAIEADEIDLCYQPKVSLNRLLFHGVEALARWNHPGLGSVSPIKFVGLAERYGLINQMTQNLLRKALKQKQVWQQRGANFNLSFNLSPLSLAEKGLADNLHDTVKEFGVEPENLVLEVTENAVSGEISAAIETLARLRLKGFKIAIDDFGTGYANAQQLSRVPATELKIDRCLINNVATNPQQQSILTRTVQLAKDMKLQIVAEGLEYPEDLAFLRSLDIDMVQGYLFAKPMTADQLQTWIVKDLAELRKTMAASLPN